MKRFTLAISTGLFASAAIFAAPASAQADDLDPETVSAAARYALPVAFDGYMSRCSAELAASGYANSNADQLRAKFNEGKDAAWPDAKVALMQMGGDGEEDMSGLFEMMDDETLKPFVDGLVQGLVVSEIKLEDCEVIERGLEILDPLPAENVAELIGFVVEMGQRDEASADDGEALQETAE